MSLIYDEKLACGYIYAYSDGVKIGEVLLELTKYPQVLEITKLEVKNEVRNIGIGTALMNMVVIWAKNQAGIKKLCLYASTDRFRSDKGLNQTELCDFYKRLGFTSADGIHFEMEV